METDPVEVREGDPADERSQELVHAMEAEVEHLYADRWGSIHSVSAEPEAMSPPGGAFLVIAAGERLVGCGGLKRLDPACCEMKRMYVQPEFRGRGLSRRLLDALERKAVTLGYEIARLDTGDRQAAAAHLYESAGYVRIPAYNGNTQATMWFEKRL